MFTITTQCLLHHRRKGFPRWFPQMFAWLTFSPPSAFCSSATFLKAFSSDTNENGILPCSPQPLTFLIPSPLSFSSSHFSPTHIIYIFICLVSVFHRDVCAQQAKALSSLSILIAQWLKTYLVHSKHSINICMAHKMWFHWKIHFNYLFKRGSLWIFTHDLPHPELIY